jgi:hypothetical protein
MSNARIAVIVGAVAIVLGAGVAVGGFFVGQTIALTVMLIVGVVFAGVGTLALFAPQLTRRSLPVRAVYVLTTRRCLVWDMAVAKYAHTFRAYSKLQVRDRDRKNSMRQKGAGDLIFAYEYHETGSDRHSQVHKIPKGFLMVERVAEVDKLIRDTLFRRGP